MAKQQRMFVLTLGTVLGAIEIACWPTRYALLSASALIVAGALLTCLTRTRALAGRLRERVQ